MKNRNIFGWIAIPTVILFTLLIIVSLNSFVLWLMSITSVFEINIQTLLDYIMWSIAMVLFIVPLLTIGGPIEIVLKKLFYNYQHLVDKLLDTLGLFLFLNGYIYLIDYYIDEIWMNIYAQVALSLIYMVIFNLLDITELKLDHIIKKMDDDDDLDGDDNL